MTHDDEPAALDARQWKRLAALRAEFLAGGSPGWRDEEDLELYARTFGERIAWKWNAVLGEASVAALPPVEGAVVEFGCGSGSASLACSSAGVAAPGATWHLLDRSLVARDFAAKRLRAAGASDARADGRAPDAEIGALVVSHVLGELDGAGRDEVVALARRARRVYAVEPGSVAGSSALVAFRDAVLADGDLGVVAPCPHGRGCPLADRDAEPNRAPNGAWCHHFAPPAAEAFTSGFWRRFAERLGIDLRALPYSFVVLDRDAAAPTAAAGLEPARILGRPRWEKGRARFELCCDRGVVEADLLKRTAPKLHKSLREPEAEPRSYAVELGAERGDATRVERIEPVG